MKSKTALMLELWIESRTRLTKLLLNISAEDLVKKIGDSPNSVGFIIRHIGDVELLFAKKVFGSIEVKVIAKTIIAQKDTGEWTDLTDLLAYVHQSFLTLQEIVTKLSESDWSQIVTTKEFGTKTKAEAFGRIVSHTAYHAGQLAIILKYAT